VQKPNEPAMKMFNAISGSDKFIAIADAKDAKRRMNPVLVK
jgi:hypothetical protein